MPSTKNEATPDAKEPPAKKQKAKDDDDDKIGQIKQSCPIKWSGSDHGNGLIQSMDEKAKLCLSVGWEKDPGEEGLVEKCLEYLDPQNKGQYAHIDYEEEFDSKAAEKALRKDGTIDDIFEFAPQGEADGGYWAVNYQCKKTLTKEEASDLLDSLFQGDFCSYPDGYDNFGKTPFARDKSKAKESGSDNSKAEEKQTKLSNLKESVLTILDQSSFVAHSSWEGHCQDEEGSSQIERQDFFFFGTHDDQKFLLQFDWSYVCG